MKPIFGSARADIGDDTAYKRFMAKVQSPNENGCVLWKGALNSNGYGRFCVCGKSTTAQRAAHIIFVGPVPHGHTVDHLCRNRACVNPAHLESVPHRINLLRGIAARHTGACPRGHYKELGSQCRSCDRIRAARYYIRTSTRRTRGWLSDDEKRQVRLLVAEGFPHSQIAKQMDISVSTVSRVRNSNG